MSIPFIDDPEGRRLADGPFDAAALCQDLIDRDESAIAATRGDRHTVIYVNRAFCRLVGKAAYRLLGGPLVEADPLFEARAFTALLERAYRSAAAGALANQVLLQPERGGLHLSANVSPLPDSDGFTVGLVVRIRDATDEVLARRRMAADRNEIREANQRLVASAIREQERAEDADQHAAELNALLETLTEGVIVVDSGKRIVLRNAVARTIEVPRNQEDATDRTGRNRFRLERVGGGPLYVDEWPLNRALRGERFSEFEAVQVRPDGTRRRVVYGGTHVKDQAGQVALAMIVVRDVTDLRQLEQEREDFLRAVSHDLRSPLTAVLGRADLIQRHAGRADQVRQSAEAIAANARRMNAMIQDLVDSTRVDQGRTGLDREPTDLRAMIVGLLDHLDGAIATDRVRLIAPAALPRVLADRSRVERIVTNLVTNALKYASRASEVTVTLKLAEQAEAVITSVSDRGPGIPASELPHLFDKFYRSSSAREHPDGLGLGLYIARGFVEAHGGWMEAESQVGLGSTFRFSLPVADPPRPEAGNAADEES